MPDQPSPPSAPPLSEGQVTAQQVIATIANAAHTIAWQAGVGGMETAGSIVSFLMANPERIEPFMSGAESVVDWGVDWHREGCLSWHGANGKIYYPSEVRKLVGRPDQ